MNIWLLWFFLFILWAPEIDSIFCRAFSVYFLVSNYYHRFHHLRQKNGTYFFCLQIITIGFAIRARKMVHILFAFKLLPLVSLLVPCFNQKFPSICENLYLLFNLFQYIDYPLYDFGIRITLTLRSGCTIKHSVCKVIRQTLLRVNHIACIGSEYFIKVRSLI